MGNAEDEVVVTNGKQFAFTGAEPLLAGIGLAFWTVTIAAGAVRNGFIPATSAFDRDGRRVQQFGNVRSR